MTGLVPALSFILFRSQGTYILRKNIFLKNEDCVIFCIANKIQPYPIFSKTSYSKGICPLSSEFCEAIINPVED